MLLIPQNEFATESQLAISGDKEGGIWLQNYGSLGKHDTSCDASCTCTGTDNVVQTQWTGTAYQGNVIHTNPGYWESGTGTNYLFVSTQTTGSVKGSLYQYQLCDSETPVCTAALAAKDPTGTTVIDFGNGATPAVSANGSPATDAIVWAIRADGSVEGTTPGILYAFDSVSMRQIYSSTNTTCTTDVIHAATKFSVPTVANGNVYLGTQSDNSSNVGKGTLHFWLGRNLLTGREVTVGAVGSIEVRLAGFFRRTCLHPRT